MTRIGTVAGLSLLAITLAPQVVDATPSTTFWAPSSPSLQSFGVLHLTYDTYFGNDGLYPVDLGLTIGVLPFDMLQAEIGVDVLYPTLSGDDGLEVPLYLNGKLGVPEDAAFPWQPGIGVGIYNLGFESDVTDYNVLYGMVGKTLPYLGTVSVGGYYGLNDNLLVNPDSDPAQSGFMAGWFSRPIDVPLIDRLHVAADVQTGDNALAAAGAGLYIYVTPAVDFLTGPVYFFEPDLQPGGNRWMWSAQLDVDLDLRKKQEPVAPPATARLARSR